jgi:CheY-like chemotaxis protein
MQSYLHKILIVHPQHEVQEKIAGELEKIGYTVSVAGNGLDGMFIAYYEKFALIISTAELPKVTGFEMMRALQNRSFNKDTPAIFIGTGNESAAAVEHAAKLNTIFMPLSAITNSVNKVGESAQFGDLLSLVKIDRSRQ